MPACAVGEDPPVAGGRVVCWSGKRPSAYGRRRAELLGDAGGYSAPRFHPGEGRYAWLSASASALSVAWELLHCPVPPPCRPLRLMVGFIYILFQQCCRASELLLCRSERLPPSLGASIRCCGTAAALSGLAGMLGVFTGRSL